MQVVYHLGAHSTDEDSLVRTLAENGETLDAAGVVVPRPKRYRLVLRDALLEMRGAPADQATQDTVLAACSDRDDVGRLIFSHEFFLCLPDRVITPQGFYTMVPDKLAPLANLFPQARTEFHMGLINPALLIPALVARQPKRSYEDIMCGLDPRDLRWAPVVRGMVEAAQGRPIVLWCNEDMPLIWPEVLRALAGLPATTALKGDDALLAQIMTEEGLERMRGYLASHPPQSVLQRRKIVTAFLDKFARPEAIEVDVPLPGWTEDLVDEISLIYDADIAEIAQMPGVQFIAA
ncbi:hypothetical protein LPB142_11435 [Rhodobacter xanthinilyticus]|uniref:Uncharacterized protein n=1 Tax=Rhodobacter xanthinilyticus TaxID=1850250 RepID=A0A1D9MDD0_9RHOB|nr:hypothetical protein [Rhodobacter xanthinilyticus]AOZ69856.1 hypothetical protein LPB142_11435 [Rhodobacter xanthinilyticus]